MIILEKINEKYLNFNTLAFSRLWCEIVDIQINQKSKKLTPINIFRLLGNLTDMFFSTRELKIA